MSVASERDENEVNKCVNSFVYVGSVQKTTLIKRQQLKRKAKFLTQCLVHEWSRLRGTNIL